MSNTYKCANCDLEMKLMAKEGGTRLRYVCQKCNFELPCNDIRVEEMYAFLSVDPKDGNEGIPAISTAYGMMPLVCADKARVEDMKGAAMELAMRTGATLRLVRFHQKEVIEVIDGNALRKENPHGSARSDSVRH